MNAVVVMLSALAVLVCLVKESDALEKICVEGQRPAPDGYCGFRIREMIKTLCSANNLQDPYQSADTRISKQQNTRDVQMDKTDALSFLRRRQENPNIRGIICECCYHRCSPEEMREYCL